MDISTPVLVVDDSRTMTTIIANLVQSIGYTDVDQVNDGASALEKLRGKKYGLVLSDWDMRPMNGTEFIQQMRQDPMNSGTLVIMITAKGDADVSWLSGALSELSACLQHSRPSCRSCVATAGRGVARRQLEQFRRPDGGRPVAA